MSKIAGIPLVLIGLILAVVLPLAAMNFAVMSEVRELRREISNVQTFLLAPKPSPTPVVEEVSPSPIKTVSPTPKAVRQTVPQATTSGQ